MFESLDKKFNVVATIPKEEEIVTYIPEPSAETISDETVSREAIRDAIKKGSKALEEILRVASSSESPRAYEVVAQIIKTLSDSSKDLLLLQKIKKDIGTTKKVSEGPRTQNNLFVGSTTEFIKELRKANLEVQPPSE